MTEPLKKTHDHKSKRLTDAEFKDNSVELCNKKIEELEKEYKELIQKPYQAGRLSEIISELGRLWNEKLKYESAESAAGGNGHKKIWQVQKDIGKVVQEVKQQIAISEESDEKLNFFIDGLLRLRYLLNEWEIELQ